ncbi:MAG: dTMP kinase [Chloroflexi bacterium]|nr:dTMP kinase [Chloroflexota bacterium]
MAAHTSLAGAFITLEGPDGAGKSTQAERLATALREDGHVVELVREPGGTVLGEQVRGLLLSPDALDHRSKTDALLFNAARAQLVAEVIRPALRAGRLVLCDRYADSTLAYQGFGDGLPVEDLRWLATWSTDGLVPDLTVLLDVPEAVGLRRRGEGPSGEQTRFERADAADQAFQARVRAGYLELAQAESARFRVVDATKEPEEVAREVHALVHQCIFEREPSTAAGRMSL